MVPAGTSDEEAARYLINAVAVAMAYSPRPGLACRFLAHLRVKILIMRLREWLSSAEVSTAGS